MTKTQWHALAFCRVYFQRNDQLPTNKAMASHFGWASVNAANEVMKALEKHRHIEKNDNGKWRFATGQRTEIGGYFFRGAA